MSNQFNILDYTDGPLLKTGQTTDYTPPGRTTKDDGGFQRGITGSKADAQYEILTTGQYAGTTNITVNGKVDVHSNECVFDKVTGLMWSRNETPAIYGAGTENLLWDDTLGANEDIFEYCDRANIANLSGFNDWRVPNILENYNLLIQHVTSLPNIIAFPSMSTTSKWTSTTQPNNISLGFFLFVTTGRIGGAIKTTTRNKLILVRMGIN